MFKFRGQAVGGKWVVGWYFEVNNPQMFDKHRMALDGADITGFKWVNVNPQSLSISTGKLDSTGTEIFASFEVNGKMTTGGDVVEWSDEVATYSDKYNVVYGVGSSAFVLKNTKQPARGMALSFVPSGALTIIGKQGVGNE